MSDFSIMSFNLRYPARDGHPVQQRLPIAAELITRARPHIIGTQEGELEMLETLIALLPEDYIWLGEGHGGGNSGEFTAVIVDAGRFDVEAADVRWVSRHPDTVASESWGVSHARTLTTVDLTDRLTGHRLRLLNTHLDHRSARSRLEAVRMMSALIAEADSPAVVTGDFNVTPDSPVHHRLCRDHGLIDTAEAAPGEDIGTFHRYRGPTPGGDRIDWILVTSQLRVRSTRVDTFSRDGAFPSDHFPVEAVLGWGGD